MDTLGVVAGLDAVLMVVEWGKTPANVMMEALYALRTVQARLLGAVITKVVRQPGYFDRKPAAPATSLAARKQRRCCYAAARAATSGRPLRAQAAVPPSTL